MQITVSKQTAKNLREAIRFLIIGCTEQNEDSDNIRDRHLSEENMKLFGVTISQIPKLWDLDDQIEKKLDKK